MAYRRRSTRRSSSGSYRRSTARRYTARRRAAPRRRATRQRAVKLVIQVAGAPAGYSTAVPGAVGAKRALPVRARF